jgi:DNA invertase Pin-like site-specific DNA recombinase
MSAAAVYARYSSDLQREASIEDQNRLCRERAAREGWSVHQEYSDSGISAASLIRPGIQKLLRDALDGRFGIILTESLDRLSRDQEDIAHIFKRISFAGGRIVTLSEGEINELHIGLKGTMGALYLKDLADKTRRGLRGRVEAGKSGGGNSYGMTGDPLALVEDRHRRCGQEDVEPSMHQPVLKRHWHWAISPSGKARYGLLGTCGQQDTHGRARTSLLAAISGPYAARAARGA